jgi:hypothetical protein
MRQPTEQASLLQHRPQATILRLPVSVLELLLHRIPPSSLIHQLILRAMEPIAYCLIMQRVQLCVAAGLGLVFVVGTASEQNTASETVLC